MSPPGATVRGHVDLVRRRVGGRFVTHEEAGAHDDPRQPTRRIVARARS